MRKQLVRVAFFLALLALWQAGSSLQWWRDFIFPSPGQVWDTLAASLSRQNAAATGYLPASIAASLRRIGIGFGLSLGAGTTLGFLLARVRLLDETLGTLVLGLQTLPSVCWLPLAILWFGLDERAIIFVVLMGACLAITVSVSDGVRAIPPLYLRAARNMGAKRLRLATSVILPASLPAITTGMKLGWSFAWRSLMAGELLFQGIAGLGSDLMAGRNLNDMSQVVAMMLVIVALGLVADRALFSPLDRHVRERWGLGKA